MKLILPPSTLTMITSIPSTLLERGVMPIILKLIGGSKSGTMIISICQDDKSIGTLVVSSLMTSLKI